MEENKNFEINDNVLVKYTGKDKEFCFDESIRVLQHGAFDDCDSLEKITISSTVEEIEVNYCDFSFDIFRGCPNLREVIIDENNAVYKSTEKHDSIISKKDGKLLYGCAASEYNEELIALSGLDPLGVMNLFLFGMHFKWENGWLCEYLEYRAAKSFDQAVKHIPACIDYLFEKDKFRQPTRTIDELLSNMSKRGYTELEIGEFLSRWVEASEERATPCYASIYLYLFGEYECENVYPKCSVKLPKMKNFDRAIELIPTYVSVLCKRWIESQNYWGDEPDDRDPDLMLKVLTRMMRSVGYSEENLKTFATAWMIEIEKSDGVYYSDMYLRLFSEHFDEIPVAIDGIQCFQSALDYIPNYLDFVCGLRMFSDEYEHKLDPDQVLYEIICRMRSHSYSENEVSLFITAWIEAMEDRNECCNSLMHVYLFGEFYFKHENTREKLTKNKISFEKALEYMGNWVFYQMDMGTQYYHGYSEADIIDFVLQMQKSAYSDEEIKIFLAKYFSYMDNFRLVLCLKNEFLRRLDEEPVLNNYELFLDEQIEMLKARDEAREQFKKEHSNILPPF